MDAFPRVAWGCAKRVRACGLLGVVRLASGWALLTALIALLICASAQAATGHEFVSSLSEAPAGSALKEPGAVAVDHASGDVFVADPGRGVVDVFSSSGAYVAQFGGGVLEAQSVAVDESSGDVYVAEPFANAVLVFRPDGSGGYALLSEWIGEGTPGGGFGEVAGVAVDNSKSASDPSAGDVYVVDRERVGTGRGAVDVFAPKPAGPEEAKEGGFLRTLTGVKLEEPNGVAVSAATGRVYVADSVKGAVEVFGSSGAFESKITGKGSPQGKFRGPEEEEGNVSAVALDETTGDVLVAEGERCVVGEFNAADEWVGWVTGTPAGGFGEPLGVAVGSSGGLYVADAALHVVDVFGPGVVLADVSTKAAVESDGHDGGVEGRGRWRWQSGELPLRMGRNRGVRVEHARGGRHGCERRKGRRDAERPETGRHLLLPAHRGKRKRDELRRGVGIHGRGRGIEPPSCGPRSPASCRRRRSTASRSRKSARSRRRCRRRSTRSAMTRATSSSTEQ